MLKGKVLFTPAEYINRSEYINKGTLRGRLRNPLILPSVILQSRPCAASLGLKGKKNIILCLYLKGTIGGSRDPRIFIVNVFFVNVNVSLKC